MFEMLRSEEVLTGEEIALSNYQRRAPHTMINILRGSQLDAATGGKSIVKIIVDGEEVEASGINTYVRNARKMKELGREELEGRLLEEVKVGRGEREPGGLRNEGGEGGGTEWTRYYSEEHGRHYLHNEGTGETRWE